MWRVVLLLLCLPLQAAAGAWPRAEGEVFVALTLSPADGSGVLGPLAAPSAYLEYGLSPRLTLGADLHTADQDRVLVGSLFLRRAMDWQGGPWALSLSLGARTRCGCMIDRSLVLGLHWGHATENGWIAADVAATILDTAQSTEAKADLARGWRLGGGWDAVITLQTGIDEAGDPYGRLHPALAWDWGMGQRVVMGYVAPLTGNDAPRLTVGTWLQF